ncbi:GntR family transcriptional regulator [Opitutaceae bacterium TAV5]|nr:GntR family transcriptional regulator [Opitutaceae bacterium TAV5]
MNPKLINRKAPYEQVKEAVYEKYIASGAEPGARLPSDRALAAEFGVNVATVAKGLTALSLEGIVSRRVGAGTFIQDVKPKHAQTVGVYLGAPVTSYAQPEMALYARLDQLLQQTLHGRGDEFMHYSDSRIREFWSVPHPALRDDAEEGKLSDLIVIRANPSNYAWLEKLPVHIIGYGVNYGGSMVDLDLAAFSRQSVEHLVKTGCKKIGLITKLPPKTSDRSPVRVSLHESFHQTIRAAGLSVSTEWIQTDDFDNTISDAEPMDSELFGYTAFQSIWNSAERPEGIVVHFDIVGLGVIRAARDLKVDLNRDVKVVFSANLGSAWSLLDNHTRMAFPVKDIVNTLIAQIGSKEPGTALVKPVLVLPPQ